MTKLSQHSVPTVTQRRVGDLREAVRCVLLYTLRPSHPQHSVPLHLRHITQGGTRGRSQRCEVCQTAGRVREYHWYHQLECSSCTADQDASARTICTRAPLASHLVGS